MGFPLGLGDARVPVMGKCMVLLPGLSAWTLGHPTSPWLSLDRRGHLYSASHTAPTFRTPGPRAASAPPLLSQTRHFPSQTRGHFCSKQRRWITSPSHFRLHLPTSCCPPPGRSSKPLAVPSGPPVPLGLSISRAGPALPLQPILLVARGWGPAAKGGDRASCVF